MLKGQGARERIPIISTHGLCLAVIAREGGRSSNRQAIITGCPAFAGHDKPFLD
jgi:hypothetical protein